MGLDVSEGEGVQIFQCKQSTNDRMRAGHDMDKLPKNIISFWARARAGPKILC
jgi:hypothetical protein